MNTLERLIEAKKARQLAAAEQIKTGQVDSYLGSKIAVARSEQTGRVSDRNLKDIMSLLD